VTLFDAAMATAHPTVARVYDNEQRVTPPATGDAWVRLSILGGAARLPELSSRLADNLGRAVVQIFTPVGTGDALSRQIANSVRNIFQSVRVSEVQLGATELVPVLQESGSPWRQVNVSTPFRFESMPV
jgi:hypothetical protein